MIAGLIGFSAALLVSAIGAAFIAWIRWAMDWEARVAAKMMIRITADFESIMRGFDAASAAACAAMADFEAARKTFGDGSAKVFHDNTEVPS